MQDTEVAVRLEAHEHKIGTLKERVKNLEVQSAAIQELAISVNRMAVSIENVLKELNQHENRLELLEKVPTETGKMVKSAVITALVGGIVGAVLTATLTLF